MSSPVCVSSEALETRPEDRKADAQAAGVEVIIICKRGHWIEADPCGVMCPFCGAWQHLPSDQICPNHECGALLEGVVYQRELRKLRRIAS